MLDLWEQIPEMRAERMMDAALAAAYPHMGSFAEEWWDMLQDAANPKERHAPRQIPPIRLNGVPMRMPRLRRELSEQLGQWFDYDDRPVASVEGKKETG
jgi:hypothetical protein